MGEHDVTVRRARRRTTLLAVIGAVVGGAAGWFTGTGQQPAVFILGVIGFAAAFGGPTAAFSIMFTTVQLSSWVSAPLRGLPREVQRHVTRAVRSGVPLDHIDRPELAAEGFRPHPRDDDLLVLYVGIASPHIS
ncbi:hypothetical protein SAMN05660766_0977 [Curtobacterium sp. 314Chir4.1]|uniref:hypothetical protein n=1 Tax=Curtobacterium sp. 314Chir4.1 TaxID=1279028 RepID=UPI000BDCCC7A|nr:hypothetical protein [Curtobacterium sp. 314Chir4.1]SOC87308.1 hypothetical protein SAMN05660766_0977 [Curtobacterium sp. 314Chir4.1]